MIKDLRDSDPKTVGPYQLLARLGAGAMGQVYLAKSPGRRLIAIKLIRVDLAEDGGFRARFANEVAAAKNVGGVFTAAVIDSDTNAELPWMATEYVAGPSLAEAVAGDGPLPVESVLALAAGLAEALGAIHRAGMVHRDLKPSNVLLATDGPRVIDFGIAHAVEYSDETPTMMGAPGFTSPEQAKGEGEVGPPADVFSLGAVLAFAATGRGPFGTGSALAVLNRVAAKQPDLTQVPARLLPLIKPCLEKDQKDRPTPAELLEKLGPEVGVFTGAWLPEAILDRIHRYSAIIAELTAPPPPSTGPAQPPAESEPKPAEPAPVAIDPEASGVEAVEPAGTEQDVAPTVPEPVLTGVSPASAQGPAAPGDSGPAQPPSSSVPPLRPRRLLIGAAAAAVVAAAVIISMALVPGGPSKDKSSPPPSASPGTTRPTATQTTATTTPTATATATTSPTKKPGKHSASGGTHSPTPTAGSTAAPNPGVTTTDGRPPPATTSAPSTTPATKKTTTTPPSGPQRITSYSGASSNACSMVGSSASGSQVGYSFVNHSGAYMYAVLLDSGGNQGPTTPVPAGSTDPTVVRTGQDWMIENSGHDCIGTFTITGNGAITVV